MPYIKTDKALRELASRQRTLNLKERALLLLADGQKPTTELLRLVQVDAATVQFLVVQGYLIPVPKTVRHKVVTPMAANTAPGRSEVGIDGTGIAPLKVSADNFDGKRSLASTRMFLFDLVERMYVRRDPAMADAFRERLRQAKDRPSMQNVAHDLLLHIEETAGAERADGISERLAMLMPDEAMA